MNFGETHNDHLQVAAETGAPGYGLFAAAVLLVAIRRRRTEGEILSVQQMVGRAMRAPLAATFFVAAMAQFPLQLAAPRLMFLTLAALSMAWDRKNA
jgi:MYXO-CTERM domain-containing protein